MFNEEKEAPKQMINGWRSKAVIHSELEELISKTKAEYGNKFVKAVLMDEIIRLGLRELNKGAEDG